MVSVDWGQFVSWLGVYRYNVNYKAFVNLSRDDFRQSEGLRQDYQGKTKGVWAKYTFTI